MACLFLCAYCFRKVETCHSYTKIEVASAGVISEKDAQRLLSSGMEQEKVETLREAGMSATNARKLAQKVVDAWEAAAKKGWTVFHTLLLARGMMYWMRIEPILPSWKRKVSD